MNIQRLDNPLRTIFKFLKHTKKLDTCRNLNTRSDLKTDGPAKTTLKLFEGLLRGDRACLARSITLIESTHPIKCSEARKLIGLANTHAKKHNLESKTFR